MDKILILVEGQTEERFIKDVLSPFLIRYNLFATPIIVKTKINLSGKDFKGGVVNYQKVKNDILKLCNDSSVKYITTLFDLYGLSTDFPGYSSTIDDSFINARNIEKFVDSDISNSVRDSRFKCYIQVHEFEALLFSSVEVIATRLSADENKIKLLNEIVNSYNNPEEINNSADTAPSKRLLKIFPNYNKVLYGSLVTSSIGIEKIMEKCPRFAEWVNFMIT